MPASSRSTAPCAGPWGSSTSATWASSRCAGPRPSRSCSGSPPTPPRCWAWVTAHGAGAEWRNVGADTGLLAVQGPRAEALVGRLADRDVTGIAYYHCARGRVAGVSGLISRTGYTGGDG